MSVFFLSFFYRALGFLRYFQFLEVHRNVLITVARGRGGGGPHPGLTGARPSPPPPSPAPPRGLTRDALSRGGSSLPDPARAQGHHGRATAHAHAAPYLRLPATARPRPTSATPKRLRILPPERRAPDERAKLNGRVGCRRGGGWGGWGHPGRLTLRSSAPPLPLTAPGVGPHPQPAASRGGVSG